MPEITSARKSFSAHRRAELAIRSSKRGSANLAPLSIANPRARPQEKASGPTRRCRERLRDLREKHTRIWRLVAPDAVGSAQARSSSGDKQSIELPENQQPNARR